MYIPELKLYAKFENSLIDSVGGVSFISSNFASVDYSNGYQMTENEYLTIGESITGGSNDVFEKSFTVGFWIHSKNRGQTHISGTSLTDISVPILEITEGNTSSANNKILKIQEKCKADNINELSIEFYKNGDSGTYAIYDNITYDADLSHFIVIHYDQNYFGPAPVDFRIFVDGIEYSNNDYTGDFDYDSSLIGGGSSPLASDILKSHWDITINYEEDGFSDSLVSNVGSISDLFILSDYPEGAIDFDMSPIIRRMINNGINSVVDSLYLYDKYISTPTLLDDPNTVTVNSIISDSSFVYVGKNNGTVEKGAPLFWETRLDYSNKKEIGLIKAVDVSNGEGGDVAATADGLVNINNNIIRL